MSTVIPATLVIQLFLLVTNAPCFLHLLHCAVDVAAVYATVCTVPVAVVVVVVVIREVIVVIGVVVVEAGEMNVNGTDVASRATFPAFVEDQFSSAADEE